MVRLLRLLIAQPGGMKPGRLKGILSVAFFSYCVVVILKLPFYFGVYLAMPQLLGIGLLFMLFIHFLASLEDKKGSCVMEVLSFILALPGCIFITFFHEKAIDYEAYGFLDTKGVVLSFTLALALLITVYRRTSWAMPALIVVMLLLVRFQHYLPGLLHGPGYDMSRLGFSFYLGTHGIFGVPFKIASTILIGFIVFGRLFQTAGGGDWFLHVSNRLLGSARGGTAKVAVLASSFFGMISGSPSANTASTGAITIPMMIETGYKPSLAGAIEAVASTGGQFMPPVMGAIIFIMAEWLDIHYSSIAFMAVLPAILYYVIVFSTIHFEALKSDRPVVARSEVIPFSQLLKRGGIYVAPLAVLILFLLILKYDPDQAVVFSLPVLIACSFLGKAKEKRLYPKKIYTSIVEGVHTWLTVAAVTAAIGIVIGTLTLSGLGVKISGFLIDISGGNRTLLLLMVGLASFILGMGLDSIPCYITVAILTAPALIKIGIPDVAAHLFVIYWGLASFFTPPVCIAVYVACGISGAQVGQTGLNAVKLGIGVFLIPFAFVLHPALLLDGSVAQIIFTGLVAAGASVAIGSGIAGHCLKPLKGLQRAILVVGAILMISPAHQAEAIGLTLVTATLIWQWAQKRKQIGMA